MEKVVSAIKFHAGKEMHAEECNKRLGKPSEKSINERNGDAINACQVTEWIMDEMKGYEWMQG